MQERCLVGERVQKTIVHAQTAKIQGYGKESVCNSGGAAKTRNGRWSPTRTSGNTTDEARAAASRVAGGPDDTGAKRRWIPSSAVRRDAAPFDTVSDTSNDAVFRKVRGILNKLTPDNFHKLSNDILNCRLTSIEILRGVILLIFEKAVDEPKYSSMYAQLCKKLSEEAPNYEPPGEPCTFRKLLLNKCGKEFQNRTKASKVYDNAVKPLSDEDEERRLLAKRKMLGNIKFIGELGKLEIMAEKILHDCIEELLPRKSHTKDMAENVECLCQIMRTCGRILDHDLGRPLMQQYFNQMAKFANNSELPQRIRFMIQDVIQLRRDGWVPRKVMITDGPMPISEMVDAEVPRPAAHRNGAASNNDLFRRTLKVREDFIAPSFGGFTNGNNLFRPASGQYGKTTQQTNNQGKNYYRGSGYTSNSSKSLSNDDKYTMGDSNGINKDPTPRYKRMIQDANLDDVSLRPSANSIVCKPPNLKQSRSQLSVRGKIKSSPGLMIPPVSTVGTKEPVIVIKPTIEKPKHNKKHKGPSKDEVVKKSVAIVEILVRQGVAAAVDEWRIANVPDRWAAEALTKLLLRAFASPTEDAEAFAFVAQLRRERLCGDHAADILRALAGNASPECSMERLAAFGAHMVSENFLALTDIAEITDGGKYHPLLLNVLQNINIRVGKPVLSKIFEESKVNLLSSLPEADRTKERLAELLDDRGLTFLQPLLRIQSDLWKQINEQPDAQKLYKWIKENLDQEHFTDAGFISALMTVIMKFVTQNSTFPERADASVTPDNATIEQEKELLKKFGKLMKTFLNNKVDLQLVAVYAVQVYCYSLDFPKGMLFRWFNQLYEYEIVEDEAFLKWREDMNDSYPGKGKALFQVNTWLQWLAEPDSDEEEDEDEDELADDLKNLSFK